MALRDLGPAEKELTTERLVLEPLRAGHAAEVFGPLQEAELHRFIPREPPVSLAALEARHRKLASRASPDGSETWLNWVGRFEGECVALFEATLFSDRRAHLAYTVFSKHARRGFGREGCARVIESLRDDWGATLVVAEIDTRNVASVRLVESLGFVRRGLRRDADFFKGATSDEYRYERPIGAVRADAR